MSSTDQTAAKLYAGIVGAVLVVAGIIGFFYNSTFTDEKAVRDAVFGILDVNGWHNVLHIASGVLGLLAYGASAHAARQYALGVGVGYVAVAIWGFVLGDSGSILSIIPVNTEDSVLHLLIGVSGVAASMISPRAATASPAAT